MADAALALPPGPKPARPRVLLVGTALAAAASWMAIAGLMGIYLSTRAQALTGKDPWLPEGTYLPLSPGTLAFGTLLLSGVTMWWAVYSVGNNDRPMTYLALGLTILFGIAVINLTTYLYAVMELPAKTTAGLLIYTVTGAHLVMLVAGLVYAAVMVFRTLGGQYSGRDREGLTAAALFWFAVIAAYAPIWLGIYVAK